MGLRTCLQLILAGRMFFRGPKAQRLDSIQCTSEPSFKFWCYGQYTKLQQAPSKTCSWTSYAAEESSQTFSNFSLPETCE